MKANPFFWSLSVAAGRSRRHCRLLIQIVTIGIMAVGMTACNDSRTNYNADIIIQNAMILTMDADFTLHDNSSLVIKDGEIAALGAVAEIAAQYNAPVVLDGANKLLMPGLINTHTHVPMNMFRGFADDLPLHEWLYENIFPLEAEFVTAENVRIGTLLAIAEMLRGGTTTFNDMYYYIDTIAEIVDAAGMRAILTKSLIDFPVPNSPTPEDGLRITEDMIRKWNQHPRITVGVAAHAPYTASASLIQRAKSLADKYGVILNIHVAETSKEREDSIDRHGLTPVGYLDSLGVLGSNVVMAHAVHLSGEDIEIMARTGVSVAHNPESNMKLASGVAPVPQMLNAGIKVGLGTDGAASNNDLDLFGEMTSSAILHKMHQNDPTVMDARAVVEMATIGGARVLGMDGAIGSLEPGKKADMILVDLMQPHAQPLFNVYSVLVYSIKASDVETVLIDGRIVMQDRKFKYIDEPRLYAMVEELAARIRAME